MISQTSELEIIVATRNAGKIREIQEALSRLPIKLLSLDEFQNISSIEEMGETYEENAVLKAVSYARQTGSVHWQTIPAWKLMPERSNPACSRRAMPARMLLIRSGPKNY